jgi:hypothetical protein
MPVTEQEWQTATDPLAMLEVLRPWEANARKIRLAAAACCRRAWRLFTSKRIRAAVEASEAYADGLITAVELETARAEAERLAEQGFRRKVRALPWSLPVQSMFARNTAAHVASADIEEVLGVLASRLVTARSRAAAERKEEEEQRYRCDLLRHIFGPSAGTLPLLDPSLLAWKDATLVKLAQAAYDERILPSGLLDPARLGILADALEEAGCTDSGLLSHCRCAGPHVRGDWVVDLLLGKE